MSLESGRKLGLTASLIAVITPLVGIISAIIFVVSIIANAFNRTTGPNPNTSMLSLFSIGFVVFIVIMGAISVAGIVLFIIAMHRLAEYYKAPGIFKNALYGFLTNIIGTAIVIITEFAFILTSIRNITNPNTTTTTIAITPLQTLPPSLPSAISQILVSFLALFVVGIILAIVSAIFYMRAFNKLAEKSEVTDFRTAGLLYLIGAALAIVGIGALLSWIAWIFAAIGFRNLKPFPLQTSNYVAPHLTTPAMSPKLYCPNCGAENDVDATYCKFCGSKLK